MSVTAVIKTVRRQVLTVQGQKLLVTKSVHAVVSLCKRTDGCLTTETNPHPVIFSFLCVHMPVEVFRAGPPCFYQHLFADSDPPEAASSHLQKLRLQPIGWHEGRSLRGRRKKK